MYKRLASKRLIRLAQQFPAVVILGARQVGKTTLAQEVFAQHPYVDLEEPSIAEQFMDDPTFQISHRLRGGIVLDEAQNIPKIFRSLRGLIDKDRSKNGQYILLGSAQPELIRGISESLAGRVGLLHLDPLTALEVKEKHGWEEVWLKGGFPDALHGDFREWHENYLRAYLERDLQLLGLNTEPLFARKLLTMIAHQQGGLLNISSLCNSLGVSQSKVRRYLDIFEQTFIIRRLPPYFTNIGKRLTKSPKIYIRDSGMLHHLLNINSTEELENHPSLGASWETFVIEEIVRREQINNIATQFFFWRTAAGAEVDLLLQRGDRIYGVEVKAGVGKIRQAKALQNIVNDIVAEKIWMIDRGGEKELLTTDVSRLGFADNLTWLPS